VTDGGVQEELKEGGDIIIQGKAVDAGRMVQHQLQQLNGSCIHASVCVTRVQSKAPEMAGLLYQLCSHGAYQARIVDNYLQRQDDVKGCS
jgi:hypothetical protein